MSKKAAKRRAKQLAASQQRGQVIPMPRRAVRRFDGGVADRLTASWTSGGGQASINSEIYHTLKTLRARSRDLQQNNEYGKHFFSMLVNNVVGPMGIGFQSRARRRDGTLDKIDNDRIEERLKRWSKVGQCDVTRKLSRTMIERLIVEILARDGEVIIRKFPGHSNDQNYALQFIDPDLLDIDHNRNESNNSGRIVMGVEVDEFWAPIGYWFLTKHPDPFGQAARSVERFFVPANEIIHDFVTMRPNQMRGVPWVHAGMRALRDLGGYRQAAVIASRLGANKVGFWTSQDGLGAPTDGQDTAGQFVDDAEPGTFHQVPNGVALTSWDPSYPHEQFADFNKAMLRGLAGAFGVSYFSLNNDLESVNLSSARIGQSNERDLYRFVQKHVTETVHDNFFPEWLRLQMMDMGIPLSRFEKFNKASWLPRTWPSPDPLKDMQTDSMKLGLNLTSPQKVIASYGHDPEEVLTEIEQWNTKLREMGLPVPIPNTVKHEDDSDEQ